METDATEDTLQVPGTISKELVLLLDIFTTPLTTAHHTPSPHVTTTQPENINHAEPVSQLLNARPTVLQVTLDHMPLTNGLPTPFTEFHQTLKKSKPKS